jgi:misacylated tRNA(Ala) deacylase
MTDLLYQTDSYMQSFDAGITALDEVNRAVLLDRTAFYPGGGGQPNDLGSFEIAGLKLPVVKVKKGPEGVWHFVGGEDVLPPVGTMLTGKIDWDRRYSLMRTHTALHILCGVVFRDYQAHVTGADMDPLNGRMDFEFETLTKDLVDVIEEAVNREVQADRVVRVQILPREEAFQIPDLIRTKINLLPPGIEFVRTVELVGLDLQADGGTHVKNTSEVGRFHIVDYKSKGKINKRVYIQLDALNTI